MSVSKFVLFGSGALVATYLIYRFLKRRNKEEVPETNTEVVDLELIDEDDVDNVQNGGFERRKIEKEPVQETPSSDVCSIPSSDVNRVPDEDSLDVHQEIDDMCHHYFGITRDEYMALEEKAARELIEKEDSSADIMTGSSKISLGLLQKEKDILSSNVSEESARTLDLFDEKDKKVEKKPEKGWKKFKKRISKFFKGDKDSKSK